MYALRESSSNEDKDTISPDFLDLHKTRFTFLKGFQELKKLMGGGGGGVKRDTSLSQKFLPTAATVENQK